AGASYFRAHGVEKVGEVDNFGFARGAFDDGHAVGESGGHHDVAGAENRGPGAAAEEHGAAGQIFRGGLDVAAFDADACAESFKSFQVEIDRARADDATAGQRDPGFF